MVEVRACVYFSVIFLCFHFVAAKPFFGFDRFWCDYFCDDEDITATTSADSDDYADWCTDCAPRRPRPTMPPPPFVTTFRPGMMPGQGMMPPGQPINVMIPPSNGMNVSFIPNPSSGWWGLQFAPWSAAPGSFPATGAPVPVVPGPPSGPTPAPAATTAAGAAPAATAAPAVTTAAPAAPAA